MKCNFNISRIRFREGGGQRSESPIAVICITWEKGALNGIFARRKWIVIPSAARDPHFGPWKNCRFLAPKPGARNNNYLRNVDFRRPAGDNFLVTGQVMQFPRPGPARFGFLFSDRHLSGQAMPVSE